MKNQKESTIINKKAKLLVNRINKELRKTLKESNIVILRLLSYHIGIENIFYSYNYYLRLLGPTISELEMAMNHAISKVFADDIYENITNSNLILSGVYTKEGLYAMLVDGYLVYSHDSNGEYYFSTQNGLKFQDNEEVKDAHIMPYKEFTTVRFYSLFIVIQGSILREFINRSANLPKIMQRQSQETQNMTYFRLFHEAMNYSLSEFMHSKWSVDHHLNEISALKDSKPYETLFNMLFGYIEKDMLMFFMNVLKESGISMNVINTTMKNTKIHMMYSSYDSNTKLKDVTFYYLFKMDTADTDKKDFTAMLEMSFCTLLDMIYYKPETMTKKQKEEYGKIIANFVNLMIEYTIQVDSAYITALGES